MLLRRRRLIERMHRRDATLTSIVVWGGQLNFMREIVNALASDSGMTIKRLVLIGCCLSNHDLALLGNALRSNSTLIVLDLRYNEISRAGAVSLAGGLHYNSSLKRLNLSHNQLGLEGIKNITTSLRVNATLTHLTLKDNGVNDSAMFALLSAMVYNATICKLTVAGRNSSITKSLLQRLDLILQSNQNGLRTAAVRTKKLEALRDLQLVQDDEYAQEVFYNQFQNLTVEEWEDVWRRIRPPPQRSGDGELKEDNNNVQDESKQSQLDESNATVATMDTSNGNQPRE